MLRHESGQRRRHRFPPVADEVAVAVRFNLGGTREIECPIARTPERHRANAIDVRIHHEVTAIDAKALADLLLVDGDPLANLDVVADSANDLVVMMKDRKVFTNALAL